MTIQFYLFICCTGGGITGGFFRWYYPNIFKVKEKWIKNNGEHDIQYNNLLTNLDRTKQIDMLKIQTDTRVDESEKKLIERIEAVEKNLQLEMELNDSDIQREIKKYVAIVK